MELKEKAEFTEKILQRLMGEILDMGRISEMSERAFKQYERTAKIKFNTVIRMVNEQVFDIKDDNVKDE